MADQDTPAFPAGVRVTLTDPSGAIYDQDQNTSIVFAALSSGQLWALMVIKPATGIWRVSVTAPTATAFRLTMQTVPTAAVVQTSRQALQPLANPPDARTLVGGTPSPSSSATDIVIVLAVAAFVGVIVAGGAAASGAPPRIAVQVGLAAFAAVETVLIQDALPAINRTSLRTATDQVAGLAGFEPGTRYNLQLSRVRQAAPFGALPNYNPALTAPVQTGGVAMSRHHIIPFQHLVGFWNAMLTNGHFSAAAGLLNVMNQNVGQYGTNLVQADLMNLRSLLTAIANGTIDHDPAGPSPDAIDSLAAVYEWLPQTCIPQPDRQASAPIPSERLGLGAKRRAIPPEMIPGQVWQRPADHPALGGAACLGRAERPERGGDVPRGDHLGVGAVGRHVAAPAPANSAASLGPPVPSVVQRSVTCSRARHSPSAGGSPGVGQSLAHLWPDKDESTKAVIDAVVEAKFRDFADSARTEGGAP